jgi:hypothetical protein
MGPQAAAMSRLMSFVSDIFADGALAGACGRFQTVLLLCDTHSMTNCSTICRGRSHAWLACREDWIWQMDPLLMDPLENPQGTRKGAGAHAAHAKG